MLVSTLHQHESSIGVYIWPLPLEPPSTSHPIPTLLGCHTAPVLSFHVTQQIPTDYFTYGNVYVSGLLFQFVPASPPTGSVSLFSVHQEECFTKFSDAHVARVKIEEFIWVGKSLRTQCIMSKTSRRFNKETQNQTWNHLKLHLNNMHRPCTYLMLS